jgi:hypothetical protein
MKHVTNTWVWRAYAKPESAGFEPALLIPSWCMKLRWFVCCCAFLVQSTGSGYSQTIVTFDDLSENGSGAWFSSNYEGLTWENIACNNAILFTNVLPTLFPGAPTNGLSGDYYGMVSASNVAEMFGNNDVNPNSEIDSATNFNFFSAYLTGTWNSNLNIEVQGFRGTNLVYDQTVVASATAPTLFTFDFTDINRLYFNSYGGDPAFGVQGGQAEFTMDNMTIEFIPEPSSLLLTALGAVTLFALVKGKRA